MHCLKKPKQNKYYTSRFTWGQGLEGLTIYPFCNVTCWSHPHYASNYSQILIKFLKVCFHRASFTVKLGLTLLVVEKPAFSFHETSSICGIKSWNKFSAETGCLSREPSSLDLNQLNDKERRCIHTLRIHLNLLDIFSL